MDDHEGGVAEALWATSDLHIIVHTGGALRRPKPAPLRSATSFSSRVAPELLAPGLVSEPRAPTALRRRSQLGTSRSQESVQILSEMDAPIPVQRINSCTSYLAPSPLRRKSNDTPKRRSSTVTVAPGQLPALKSDPSIDEDGVASPTTGHSAGLWSIKSLPCNAFGNLPSLPSSPGLSHQALAVNPASRQFSSVAALSSQLSATALSRPGTAAAGLTTNSGTCSSFDLMATAAPTNPPTNRGHEVRFAPVSPVASHIHAVAAAHLTRVTPVSELRERANTTHVAGAVCMGADGRGETSDEAGSSVVPPPALDALLSPPPPALDRFVSVWSDIRAAAARNFQLAASMFKLLPEPSSSSSATLLPVGRKLSMSSQLTRRPLQNSLKRRPSVKAPAAAAAAFASAAWDSAPGEADQQQHHLPVLSRGGGNSEVPQQQQQRPRRTCSNDPQLPLFSARGEDGSTSFLHQQLLQQHPLLGSRGGSVGPASPTTARAGSRRYSAAEASGQLGSARRSEPSVEQELPSSVPPSRWSVSLNALNESSDNLAFPLPSMIAYRSEPGYPVARTPSVRRQAPSAAAPGLGSRTVSWLAAAGASAPVIPPPVEDAIMIGPEVNIEVKCCADGTPVKIRPDLGVTVEYLAMFARHVANLESDRGLEVPDEVVTTAEVLRAFVRRQTISRHCSFAELVPPRHHAPPVLFVSHSHSASFAGLVTSVLRFCRNHDLPETTGIFLDVLCMNPYAPAMTPSDMATHWTMIERCKHLLLVVDHKGSSLSRLWCCYEAWIAALVDKSYVLAATVAGVSAVKRDKLQVVFDRFDVESFLEVFACLKPSSLQVRDEADREAIVQHTTTLVLGVDLDGLDAMLPTVHAGMLQCTLAAYDAAVAFMYKQPTRYIDASVQYGIALVLMGQATEAVKIMRQDHAWALQNKVPACEGTRLLANSIALLDKRNGQYNAAESLCLEGLCREVDDQRLPLVRPQESPVSRLLLVNLQDVMFRSGDVWRCEALCRRLVDAGLEGKVVTKPLVFGMLQPMRQLGELLVQRGAVSEVLDLLVAEPLRLTLNDVSSNAAEVTALQCWLAGVHLSAQCYVKATEALRLCVKTRRLVYGPTHALTLEALVTQAGICLEEDEAEHAERVLQELHATVHRHLGPAHPVADQLRMHLAALRDKLAELAQQALDRGAAGAEALFRRALKVNKSVGSAADEAALLANLMEALQRRGKTDEAQFLKRRYRVYDGSGLYGHLPLVG